MFLSLQYFSWISSVVLFLCECACRPRRRVCVLRSVSSLDHHLFMNREGLVFGTTSSAVSLIAFVIAWSLRLKSSSEVGSVIVVDSFSFALSVLLKSSHMVCL